MVSQNFFCHFTTTPMPKLRELTFISADFTLHSSKLKCISFVEVERKYSCQFLAFQIIVNTWLICKILLAHHLQYWSTFWNKWTHYSVLVLQSCICIVMNWIIFYSYIWHGNNIITLPIVYSQIDDNSSK